MEARLPCRCCQRPTGELDWPGAHAANVLCCCDVRVPTKFTTAKLKFGVAICVTDLQTRRMLMQVDRTSRLTYCRLGMKI